MQVGVALYKWVWLGKVALNGHKLSVSDLISIISCFSESPQKTLQD